MSKNFVDAWNRVATADQKIQRAHDLRSPPAGLKLRAGKAAHRAQIVRTQAEEGDKTIQRLYRQATSFASNYIYIENQYFQYTEWARYLKQLRRDFIAAWQAAGQSLKKLPNLHVFIVIPTPERAQMVPATHETVRELGHGSSMPNQDKKVEGKSSPGNVEITKELESLGIKTLVASLWTYDHAGDSKGEKYREIYIHSKLMIIDDAFFTLGSANLNLRSMAVDAEINIGCDDARLSGKLRNEVFVLHSDNADGCSGGDGSTSEMGSTFSRWEKLLVKNRVARSGAAAPHGFLHPFRDDRSSFLRIA